MSIRLRNFGIIFLLGIVAIGAVALTGLWHPQAPMASMQSYLPQITLPTVLVAGAVDGINPCAFTVLLLFITAITASVQIGEQNIQALRLRLLKLGGIYIAAVFLTYLALGVGLFKTLDVVLTSQHAPARLAAL